MRAEAFEVLYVRPATPAGDAGVVDLLGPGPQECNVPPTEPTDHECNALVGQRTALILLLGALTGIGAGLLTTNAGSHLAQAVLVGAAASAAAIAFFNSVIARR